MRRLSSLLCAIAVVGMALIPALALGRLPAGVHISVTPDPAAPAGSVPKLSFVISGIHPRHEYDVSYQLIGSRGRAHCTQLGEVLASETLTHTMTLGPAPYGDYTGDRTYRGFCARRVYKALLHEQVGSLRTRVVGSFTFRAPGVRR